MKTFLRLTLFIVISLIVLIIAATQLISSDDIFAQLSDKVTSSTGRTLIVDGSKQLSFFPSLSLVLNDVRFSNKDTVYRADMAKIKNIHIHIPWSSAFSGELKVDKFVIVQPDVLLEKYLDGSANWQLLSESNKVNDNVSTNKSQKDKEPVLPESFDISLGQVEVVGGKVTFFDHHLNEKKELSQLDVAVTLPSLHKKLDVVGNVTYMAEQFEVNAIVETPAQAINQLPFDVSLSLTSSLANLTYQGKVLDKGQKVTGHLSVAGNSVKQLLDWQAISLNAKEEAFNQFKLDTKVIYADNKVSFDELEMNLDKLSLKGNSTITLSTPVELEAKVDLGILDLNPYLPVVSDKKVVDNAAQTQPIVWDDTSIDLSALNNVKAHIVIRSSQLLARDLKLGKTHLTTKLIDGTAVVLLHKFEAYDGVGSGVIQVSAKKSPYNIETNFSLNNINVKPLLIDASGFDKLLGKGDLSWKLLTNGVSQRDFINQLSGEFSLDIKDGAIKGVNLAAIAKSASSILKGDIKSVSLDRDFSQADKTDFAALQAKFSLSNGVANTESLSLKNPFIRVNGVGEVDLPKTNVNLQVKSKLVASVQGQASNEETSGFTIPIKIVGPFHQVKVKPDISAGAKDKVKDKIKDKVKDKLKNLFG